MPKEESFFSSRIINKLEKRAKAFQSSIEVKLNEIISEISENHILLEPFFEDLKESPETNFNKKENGDMDIEVIHKLNFNMYLLFSYTEGSISEEEFDNLVQNIIALCEQHAKDFAGYSDYRNQSIFYWGESGKRVRLNLVFSENEEVNKLKET